MKKLIIALSLATTFVATKSEAQTNSTAKSTEKGTKELVILHTNDTHSCIYPLNSQLADTLKAGRGGFLRRIAMLKEERKKNPDLLLFDSGDFSQGSPYYTLFKGDVEVGLMNKMHYDAVTIGNHEFDFGLKNMERLFKKANFPIVCANYDFTGTPLAKIVKPYVVLKRKGIKIGVFGLAPQLDGLVDAKNYETVRYINPITATNEVVSTLKNKEGKLEIPLSKIYNFFGNKVYGKTDTFTIALVILGCIFITLLSHFFINFSVKIDKYPAKTI